MMFAKIPKFHPLSRSVAYLVKHLGGGYCPFPLPCPFVPATPFCPCHPPPPQAGPPWLGRVGKLFQSTWLRLSENASETILRTSSLKRSPRSHNCTEIILLTL